MAELRKGATGWEKDLFLVNCLLYLQVRIVGSSRMR